MSQDRRAPTCCGASVAFVASAYSEHPAGPAEERPALLVSACLLGVACNHRGEANMAAEVVALGERARLIPVCPEVAGGLSTPRPAAEMGAGGSVRTAAGEDVTDAYRRGAAHAVALARAAGVIGAVLKARSPSCGCHQVYDGSHRRVLRDGQGVSASALSAAGVAVCSEEDVGEGALPWTDPGA